MSTAVDHELNPSDDQSDMRVSETGRVIEVILSELPEQTVDDLARLIQRRLTMLDVSSIRYARLGLLIDVVSTGTGEVPSTRAYDAARDRAALGGESWPSHSTLVVAYGGWVNAVRAAMMLWIDGSVARVPVSNHHRRPERAYRLEEATGALLACSDALTVWPTEQEYEEWRRLSREMARNAGLPYPRYPSRQSWRKLYGNWPAFEAAARRRVKRGAQEAGDSE